MAAQPAPSRVASAGRMRTAAGSTAIWSGVTGAAAGSGGHAVGHDRARGQGSAAPRVEDAGDVGEARMVATDDETRPAAYPGACLAL